MLEELHLEAEKIFVPVVRSLGKHDPRLPGRLLPHDRRPAIIVRVLRYEPGYDSGTPPHCDKSAISAVMNSNDPAEENFVVGPPGCSTVTQLHQPYRYQLPYGDRTSAIVFPGKLLEEAGFTWLKPTVHAVKPYTAQRRRHAVAAFLLVPYLKMDHIETNVQLDGYVHPLIENLGHAAN